MPLEDYAKKRSFSQTPEPGPDAPAAAQGALQFCIQRHHAKQAGLHYDLRLEVDGVLKSWAVPKGPTLDPTDKRMAVHVEDHPLEYADFEGVIPPGNYGAGSMMLWDRGTYELLGDISGAAQLERGDFKFRLHGQKLRGDFAVVRTKRGKNDWLLIKKKDPYATAGWDVEAHQRSVLTGRTQEEIALEMPSLRSEHGVDPSRVPGAQKAPMPGFVAPMAAYSTAAPPGEGWLYEVKWDGYRALCYLDHGVHHLFTRNGNSLDQQYPCLDALPECVRAETAIVDGEIVALDEHGLPRFGLLQRRNKNVVYYAFDLLYLNGYDLRRCEIEERKRLLEEVLQPNETIRLSDAFPDQGDVLLAAARQRGLEGIVAKRAHSTYEHRRSYNWLKIKLLSQQEFVICGYALGDRPLFGSLVLGLYDKPDSGKPAYVGNVGSGFDQQTIEGLYQQLRAIETAEMQTTEMPEINMPIVWVRPELVCTVRFSSWTDDHRLRAPVYVGLRPEVAPRECVRDADIVGAAPSDTVITLPPPLVEGTAEQAILTVDERRLKFTNLNKLYYPQEGYTKRDVINYYNAVSPLILPHLIDRPLSLRRYPDGITGESFFQKDAAEHFPEWLRRVPIFSEHNQAPIHFVVADDKASLLFLANLGCIDQNPWMSRVASIEHPDFLLIDLDPQDCGYDKIVEAAQLVRQKLERVELEGYPKTTGGDGMHIYVPLEPVYTYEQVRSFTEVLARILATERPDLFTTPRAVSRRERNKVYFDWMQISTGKTISAPYVLRAYPGAPVATPLTWREVKPGLTPQQFHIRNVLERFSRLGDLFEAVLTKPQRLDTAVENLDRLVRR